MGFDSVCDTGLVLGLSLGSSPSMINRNTMGSAKKHLDHGVTEPMQSFEPSLTLSLSGNHRECNNKRAVAGCVSDHSGGVGSEESERVSNDNNYSGVISATSVDDVEEDDDGCVNGRKKLRLTKPQSALLEEAFKHHSSLNLKQKQELARELKLRPRQVEVWFQNRRARTKLKQTEMEFEHLKKFCDKLTCENRKLQKELQELKALKSSSQPFYMQLPAAGLSVCPSCERIGDTKSSLVKNPFTLAAKPHCFNPFTNPSAAC
ncbi:putative transcription factor homeobox-WOX family [Helianthus annuus]|nr:putative transcription factor homeobox-WOX family [Helianthus annuus]